MGERQGRRQRERETKFEKKRVGGQRKVGERDKDGEKGSKGQRGREREGKEGWREMKIKEVLDIDFWRYFLFMDEIYITMQ